MPKAAKTSALWERLIRARLDLKPAKSINQEDIAKEIGVGQTAVSGWKTGRIEPSVKSAKALCLKADLCVEFLYSGRGPRRPWGDITTPLGKLVELWEHLTDADQVQLLAYAELLNRASDKPESAPISPRLLPGPKPAH
jgi:transcriptional regulator with XRE-family HTH domain